MHDIQEEIKSILLQYIECRFTKPEGLQLLRIYCSELAEVNYKTLYIGI